LALLKAKDPDLAQLVEAWPNLTKRVKAELVRIAKSKDSRIEYALAKEFEKRHTGKGA
jgi:hypothetical protein